MEIARRLLRHDDLRVGILGWIAKDLPPGKRTLLEANKVVIPNLLTSRSLAIWLHHEACTSADPGVVLTDLDRLNAAFSRPGCLIDAMIWAAIARIRDEAYLHLVLLGRLPNSHRGPWLAERCHLQEGVAAGFDGERTWYSDAWVRWVEEMGLIGSFHDGSVIGSMSSPPSKAMWWDPQCLYSGPWLWSTSHHDMAIVIQAEAQVSARLRGEITSYPDRDILMPRMWGYGAICLPNLIECAVTSLEGDARHRMFRIAVRILDRAPTEGLPLDRDDLQQWLGESDLLAPLGDHLYLTYERLGDERFRLIVSPTSPVPNFDPPGRLAYRNRAYGKPPTKGLLVIHPHLESQLPARLQRAPPAPGIQSPARLQPAPPAIP